MADSGLYQVSDETIASLDRQIAHVRELLHAPGGSRIDPGHLRETLTAVLARGQATAKLDTSPSVPYDPGNFLYITAPAALRNRSVESLEGLGTRILNCFGREHIETVGELIACSRLDILDIRNLGDESLRTIEHVLAGLGLHLAVYDPRFTPPPGDKWVRLSGSCFTLHSRLCYTHISRLVDYSRDDRAAALWSLPRLGITSAAQLLELTPDDVLSLPWHDAMSAVRLSSPQEALAQITDHLGRLGLSLA